MPSLQKFFKFKPREISGSSTSKRYDYQKHWALCKLLQLHASKTDYLMVLEYHDDIVIFDQEKEPTKAEFIQVKTKKSGTWKVGKLINRDKDESLSTMGKLYDHKIKFGDEVASLAIVSNVHYELLLANKEDKCTDKEAVCMMELDAEIIEKIKDAVKKEHSLEQEIDMERITFFIYSDLSLDDFETHTKGKLVEFFEKMMPGKKHSTYEIYRSLIAEINRKNNKIIEVDNLERLSKEKGIGKSYFDMIVKIIQEQGEDRWPRIEQRLGQEHVGFDKVDEIRNLWTSYIIRKADYADNLFRDFMETVSSLVKEARNKGLKQTVLENVYEINKAWSSLHSKEIFAIYEAQYLDCVILEALFNGN